MHRNRQHMTARTRTALETALQAAEVENAQAIRDAERAAATYGDLAEPCTDMLFTAWAVRQIRHVLDGLELT